MSSAAARPPAAATTCGASRNSPALSTRSDSAPTITKTASAIASGASTAPPRVHAITSASASSAQTPAAMSRCAAPSRSPRFHASNGPNGTASSSGTNKRTERQVEERSADRNLLTGQRLQRQRIKRSDEHRRARGGQQQIVEHQRALARDRREQAALRQLRCAPGIQREAAADEDAKNGEDEHAAGRIGGKSMHRCQHAGAHEERAQQRQRERENCKQDGPDLQRIPLLHHHGRMQTARCRRSRASAMRSRPGPRTTSRPSRVRSRPSRIPWRCRASGRSRPAASRAEPSAPTPR